MFSSTQKCGVYSPQDNLLASLSPGLGANGNGAHPLPNIIWWTCGVSKPRSRNLQSWALRAYPAFLLILDSPMLASFSRLTAVCLDVRRRDTTHTTACCFSRSPNRRQKPGLLTRLTAGEAAQHHRWHLSYCLAFVLVARHPAHAPAYLRTSVETFQAQNNYSLPLRTGSCVRQ